MEEFDDGLPQRKFDNFQFVNFAAEMAGTTEERFKDVNFSVAALQEIPEQYWHINQLGYL